jgi:hypothetical protein
MYLFIGAHQADENVFSSQFKNKITKYSPGLAEASWLKRERFPGSATAAKPHGIATKVRGEKIEPR